MAQSDVFALIASLSNNQAFVVVGPPDPDPVVNATSTRIQQFYTEAMRDFAQKSTLVSLFEFTAVADQPAYDLPTTAVALLAAFADGVELSLSNVKECEGVAGAGWHLIRGTPRAVLREEDSVHRFRLFPRPASFPITLQLLCTEIRIDAPAWLDLSLALGVLRREFSVDSPHQDVAYSQACGQLQGLINQLLL